MSQPWIRKYQPENLEDVVGNSEAKYKLKYYAENYKKGKKPLFIYGGTGNGKTSSVYALANEKDLEIVELNASDTRKADVVKRLLSGVINQGSLFGKKKIILIDEIEGISGQKDRGALQAIQKITAESIYPVILIGQDAYSDKAKPIRKKSELVEYRLVEYTEIYKLLVDIVEKEKILYEERALKQLARAAGGDVRAAVNDLQTLSHKGKINLEDLQSLGNRNPVQPIKQALCLVFKAKKPDLSLRAFDNVDEDLDKVFLWMEENLPREYTHYKDLKQGFENLSLADVYYGRIRRRQHYRFYVYCYNLLTAGISLSKQNKYTEQVTYKQSNKPLKIWIANQSNAKKKDIATKIAEKDHLSKKEAAGQVVPYIKVIYKKNSSLAESITKRYELNKEEIEWLKKP